MSTQSIFESLQRGGLRQDMVGQLLTAIFQGRFHANNRLIVQKLAAEFGVSATPVREALVELAGIGLVDLLPNRGAVVRPFGEKQLREIYQVRRVLEVEATREACGQIPPEMLSGLQAEMNELAAAKQGPKWVKQAMAADRSLHRLIALHCGSRRLQDEIAKYNVLVQTAREIVRNENHAIERAIHEHIAILNALAAVEPEQAGTAVSIHIKHTADMVVEAMFPNNFTIA